MKIQADLCSKIIENEQGPERIERSKANSDKLPSTIPEISEINTGLKRTDSMMR